MTQTALLTSAPDDDAWQPHSRSAAVAVRHTALEHVAGVGPLIAEVSRRAQLYYAHDAEHRALVLPEVINAARDADSRALGDALVNGTEPTGTPQLSDLAQHAAQSKTKVRALEQATLDAHRDLCEAIAGQPGTTWRKDLEERQAKLEKNTAKLLDGLRTLVDEHAQLTAEQEFLERSISAIDKAGPSGTPVLPSNFAKRERPVHVPSVGPAPLDNVLAAIADYFAARWNG